MNLILHKNGSWINKSKNSRHMGGDVDLQLINFYHYVVVNAFNSSVDLTICASKTTLSSAFWRNLSKSSGFF